MTLSSGIANVFIISQIWSI